MQCPCKICRNRLSKTANDKFVGGFSLAELKGWLLNDHKLDVSETTIKRHLEKFNFTVNENPQPKAEIRKIESNLQPMGYDFKAIRFSKFADENNPIDVLTFLQNAHLHLYEKQLEIVAKEQDLYYQGLSEDFPVSSVQKLRMLQEMFANISGVFMFASQQAAIRKIQSMGLTVEEYQPLELPDVEELEN